MVNSSQDFTLRLQFDIQRQNRHDSIFHAKIQYNAFSITKCIPVSLYSFITSFIAAQPASHDWRIPVDWEQC